MVVPWLDPKHTGLLLVDLQVRLTPLMQRAEEVVHVAKTLVKGARLLQLPIIVAEQYPQGLGETIPELKQCLPKDQIYLPKTTFSCLGDQQIASQLKQLNRRHWLVIGIETHVCVLQTVRDLGDQGVVIREGVSSRHLHDEESALSEMAGWGVRLTTLETVLFEMLQDSRSPAFKAVSAWIR